ncbi:DeoR/GlpR family DNA-binding transcription regulator [Microbacterium sp. G2-8]|uniref:DeoR/GlpR family DNA-binding transcription regulator n=1 Tax=Microbacterium sp. G2-8 TaxID=2842454 RepID=UPI001C88F5D3|nr:DeoR/GlpR family DNA-binding transcription regulator [Microbacterium sp. G2-8]
MSTTSSVHGEQRRRALAEILEREGSVQLAEAAAALGVSEMTIRRDLDGLEQEGVARRVRGGATRAVGPRPFGERMGQRRAAKARIAQKVLDLVPAHGAIALDASTTAGVLAEQLGRHEDLLVVTNSWENFGALRRAGTPRATLTGGQADDLTGSLVGPMACRAAAAVRYSTLFASGAGVDVAHGASDVSLEEAQVKLEFARGAERVVLLVDSTKLGNPGMARGLEWGDVALLVTELDVADARLDPYRELVEIR